MHTSIKNFHCIFLLSKTDIILLRISVRCLIKKNISEIRRKIFLILSYFIIEVKQAVFNYIEGSFHITLNVSYTLRTKGASMLPQKGFGTFYSFN